MTGCATLIGFVAFLIGLIFGLVAALIVNDPTFPSPLIAGAMTGGMAFVAALILLARDRGRHAGAIRSVRQRLLARHDVSDPDFAASFPDRDPTLITQTRYAVAQFFDVPVYKIHPTDRLRSDLQFDSLEPSFHAFVVYHVLNAPNVEPRSFSFNTGGLADIGDLADEIQRVLDAWSADGP